jgi:hypothetical protein
MPVRGGSRGKKRSTLHSLGRAKFDVSNTAAIYRELATSSDRAAAILGATSLQAILRNIIIDGALINRDDDSVSMLMERDGALATSFSINHLAFALGLIPRIFLEDLETIRRIRNVFAHSVLLLDFRHDEISREAMKLRSLYFSEAPENEFKKETGDEANGRERNLFISTCRYISYQLLLDHADPPVYYKWRTRDW